MYTTPEEGSRSIEQNLPGLLGHLLHTNSNFAVPAVRTVRAADKFGAACIRHSKPWAAQFSKEGTDALHT